MNLVACGDCGFGDLIWEIERGRPFGMSALKLSRRDSLREEEDECLSLDEEECLEEECFSFSECWRDELDLEDLLEDLSLGTSRMFKMRPVVGSVVDDCPGSCDT
jgi:hypothetical protein